MTRYFCSSDIHSFFDVWMLALNNKGFDISNNDHHIIICGDVFDRGSQSVECYKFIKSMSEQKRLIYIRGNHEDLLDDCVQDLARGRSIGRHHVTNGTIKTISHFMNCSEYDLLCSCYEGSDITNKCSEVINFIDTNCVDYFELGNKVFVHGWVPVTYDIDGNQIVHKNWRDGDWYTARWSCGFDAWGKNLIPPDNKTVVCGHWHTSYGWSKFRGRSEWEADAEFTTFIDNNIIALDACTAYTSMVNVIVFDSEGNIIEE